MAGDFQNSPNLRPDHTPNRTVARKVITFCAGLVALSAIAADPAADTVSPGGIDGPAWAAIAGALVLGIAVGWLFGHRRAGKSGIADLKAPALRFHTTGKVAEWNGAAEKLALACGLPGARALSPEDFSDLASAARSEGTGKEMAPEWVAGEHWFSGTVGTIEADGSFTVFISCITERRQWIKETAQVREEAEGVARMTSEYVSNISHDIRVPMSGVIGLGKLLLETDLNPEQRELGRTLVDSAESVVALADELLDLAKIEAGKLEIVDRPTELSSIIEETLRSQSAHAAEKRLDLFCEINPGLPGMIQADTVRVRQVLANLVSNAIKFTNRGEVVVRVEEQSAKDGGEELRFAVRDTGTGIPEEKRDRLFKAFNQADSSTYKLHGGTGLGLVTSRRLAELMGGKLWFESEPNRGSTFFFTLPIRPVSNSVPPPWTLDQPRLNGVRAILVEDNPGLLNLIDSLMVRWGIKVTSFRSAGEAMAWLDRNPPPQLALIDLDLPELAAITLLHRLADSPGVPPRMLGMAFEPQARSKSPVNFELLLKPVCNSTLLDHLRRPTSPPVDKVASAAPSGDRDASDSSVVAPPAILVADDDPVNRRVVRNFLERLRCVVTTVPNGSDALLRMESEKFDVVFLDLMMPGMNGLSVVRAIREREAAAPKTPALRRQPVIALTAKAMAGDAEASMEAGFDAHVTKPVSEQTFREMLERFAGYSQSAPPTSRQPRLSMLQAPGNGIVDNTRLDELGSGDPAVIADIAKMYFDRIAQLAPEISSALVQARFEDAQRHAHTGAGSSSTAGMIAASTAFRKLEATIKVGDLASGDKLLAEALEAVERCRKAVQPYLQATSQPQARTAR